MLSPIDKNFQNVEFSQESQGLHKLLEKRFQVQQQMANTNDLSDLGAGAVILSHNTFWTITKLPCLFYILCMYETFLGMDVSLSVWASCMLLLPFLCAFACFVLFCLVLLNLICLIL